MKSPHGTPELRELSDIVLFLCYYNSHNPFFNKTALQHLLYLGERIFYASHGKPFTVFDYRKTEYGPVIDGSALEDTLTYLQANHKIVSEIQPKDPLDASIVYLETFLFFVGENVKFNNLFLEKRDLLEKISVHFEQKGESLLQFLLKDVIWDYTHLNDILPKDPQNLTRKKPLSATTKVLDPVAIGSDMNKYYTQNLHRQAQIPHLNKLRTIFRK